MWNTSDPKCAVSTDAIQRAGRGATPPRGSRRSSERGRRAEPLGQLAVRGAHPCGEPGCAGRERAGQHHVAIEGALLRGRVAREWLDVLYARVAMRLAYP